MSGTGARTNGARPSPMSASSAASSAIVGGLPTASETIEVVSTRVNENPSGRELLDTGAALAPAVAGAETEGAGLATVKATYWNTLLFPLMVLRRKLFRGGSDVHAYPALVDRFFQAALATERALLAWGSAPFGGSVFVVGQRRD